MNETDRFKVGLHGLSEDMEDFMLERDDYFTNNPTKFWSSFWSTCVSMWQNGVDLSHIQLDIIQGEYKKENRK